MSSVFLSQKLLPNNFGSEYFSLLAYAMTFFSPLLFIVLTYFSYVLRYRTLIKELGLGGKITGQQASKKWENLKKKYKVSKEHCSWNLNRCLNCNLFNVICNLSGIVAMLNLIFISFNIVLFFCRSWEIPKQAQERMRGKPQHLPGNFTKICMRCWVPGPPWTLRLWLPHVMILSHYLW